MEGHHHHAPARKQRQHESTKYRKIKRRGRGQQGRSDIVGPRAEMVSIAYIQHDAMRCDAMRRSKTVLWLAKRRVRV